MKIYIVNLKFPPAKIIEKELEIKVCPKTVWAIEKYGRRHERRYLLGSSAFQTISSAERSRTTIMQKIIQTKCMKYLQPFLYKRCEVELGLATPVETPSAKFQRRR